MKLTAVIMGFGGEHLTTNIRNITQNNHTVQYKTIYMDYILYMVTDYGDLCRGCKSFVLSF